MARDAEAWNTYYRMKRSLHRRLLPTVACAFCQHLFKRVRKDKQYCSTYCRQTACRIRRAA